MPGSGTSWSPIMSKPVGDFDVFVQVLEKAWAKLHRSYYAIIGGQWAEVMSRLTQAPITKYKHNNNAR
jgi:hypothetical protein